MRYDLGHHSMLTVRRFEELGADSLTSLLHESGTLRAGAVRAVEIEPIGVGAGLLGQVARLRLTYDGRDEAAPPTLVGKLPTVDPGSREIRRIFKLYEREIQFYRDVAHEVPLRTPKCHAMLLDVPADNYLLLLEDLSGLLVGDDATGCSAADAEAAIRTIGTPPFPAKSRILTSMEWLSDKMRWTAIQTTSTKVSRVDFGGFGALQPPKSR